MYYKLYIFSRKQLLSTGIIFSFSESDNKEGYEISDVIQ